MKRISVDIGGTFTDCFIVYNDKYISAKALTTHHNLAIGFMDSLRKGCEQLNISIEQILREVDSVRYATTLGTNTLLERNGPNVGLITTAGYESSVPLSRGRGYGDGLSYHEQQDLSAAERPDPLVPANMIVGVRERIDYKGNVLLELDEDHLRKQLRYLVDNGAQAFVVNLVNSVMNPIHEKRIEEIILQEYPSHMLGALPIILSHQVVGRKGEYARATASIIDAYLHEQMYHGLSSLEMTLREYGYDKPMLVVHNTGGMAQLNSTHALQTINSGPTSGVNMSDRLAEELDTGRLITLDMGGTSADIGLNVREDIKFYDFSPTIDRWLVNTPMLHLKVVGAGGGSIARYDEIFKTIEVGPTSAGSDPGPACYDRGGMEPTVTDADLILGYLDPDYYAGGSIKLNKQRAEFAIEEYICDEIDISITEAAKQIKEKVDTNMAHGISQELGVKGYNPIDFTLLAYGGNGPLHACGIANVLGIDKILIPPFSPIFSAVGAGVMEQLHIHERNVFMNIYDSNTREFFKDFDKFNSIVETLVNNGKEDLLRQEMKEEDIKFRLELDMRYGNQLAETSVVSPMLYLNNLTDVINLIEAFSSNYGQRFGEGSQSPEAGIRINTIRVISYIELDSISFKQGDVKEKQAPNPKSMRECHFVGFDESIETPIYDANDLIPGVVIEGPAIVESTWGNYLIEPGWEMKIGEQNLGWIEKTEANLKTGKESKVSIASK